MNILEMHARDVYVPSKPAVRPGAEDALKLPSLVNGVRVPYKPPSNGCVGILKDRTSHTGVYQENLVLR
jgi:hypothetical protein